jgi:hypothetical protein
MGPPFTNAPSPTVASSFFMNHAHNYPSKLQHTLCTCQTTTLFSYSQFTAEIFVAVLAVNFSVDASFTFVQNLMNISSTSNVLTIVTHTHSSPLEIRWSSLAKHVVRNVVTSLVIVATVYF